MGKTPNDKQTLAPEAAVDRLEAIYAGSCAALGRALDRYLATRKPPTPKDRAAFRYPLLRVVCRQVGAAARTRRAFAKFQRPGVYAITITHAHHFRRYLLEQLEPLVAEYDAEITVEVSGQEIPYPYVLERVDDISRTGVTASELARHFPTPLLSLVGDEVVDGQWEVPEGEPRPLSLFDAVSGQALPSALNSCAGAWPGWPRTVPIRRWCCRAAPRSGEATFPKERRKPSPRAHGTGSRCPPTTSSRATARA